MEWFKNSQLQSRQGKVYKILDVGSFCVAGHLSYRQIFDGDRFEYIGLDMVPGPNVDIAVKNPYKWEEIPDNFCDVLISGQSFEHIEFPWLTITEIARVLKPNCFACIIAPNGSILHRYPVDCWRFFGDGFIALAKWAGLEVLHISVNLAPIGAAIDWYSGHKDVMMVLQKPNNWNNNVINISNYSCSPSNLDELAKPLVSYELQCYNYKMKSSHEKLIGINKNRNLFFWGTGNDADKWLDRIKIMGLKVNAFVDSNNEKYGKNFNDYDVISPTELFKEKLGSYFVVIASTKYANEITIELEMNGLLIDEDFFKPNTN
jgi:SAM-dependent methyltransferase